MYTKNLFQFQQKVEDVGKFKNLNKRLNQQQSTFDSKFKKTSLLGVDPIDNADSTGSILNLSDFNNSHTALIGTICLATGFLMMILMAAAYYYRKRGSYHDFSPNRNAANHKILLLKKEIPLEKSYIIKKTPAVRSPSSSQVNPFNKKSPSPTSTQQPTIGLTSPKEESKSREQLESIKVIGSNSSSKPSSPTDEKNKISTTTNIETNLTNNSNKMENIAINNSNQQMQKCLGKLHFKLKYSYEKRALSLIVVRCDELPMKEQNGTLDPYVKMQLLPEKQHKAKTRVLRKTQNPIYNEEFTFYGITSNLLDKLAVHFVILNFDRFSRDELIGEVVCRLNQLEFDSLEKQITLCREISPICGNKLKMQDLGELLVSLCYQPIANRLTVVILKARNLPKMDLTGFCDPYVKIYLLHKGERISKKRTHIKKRTLNPVFNESFIFDIPTDESLENIRLQFMIFDHDRVTRNELIGKVEIGSKTGSSTTEKHWNEVIKSPRRQIAEWHKLQDVTGKEN